MGIDCIDSRFSLNKFKIFRLKTFMKSFKGTLINKLSSLKEIIDIYDDRYILDAACTKY